MDGYPFCITLEDQVRVDDPETSTDEGAKVFGQTAIPAGQYNITITFSQKFQKRMILVENVPGFTGIRVHGGNTAADTLGCILVGTTKLSDDKIVGATGILPVLFQKIEEELSSGNSVTMTIYNASPV